MIAIPNMDKPKVCVDCSVNDMVCGLWMEVANIKAHRHKDCPLIDIVTCGECKHWKKFEGGVWEEVEGEYGFCTLRVDAYKPFGEDNFCSYGERRTDE